MKLSVSHIANLVDGFVEGDKTKEITGIALMDEAKSCDLTYVRKESDLKKITSTNAGVIVVPPILSLPLGKTYIKVDCLPEQVLPIILKTVRIYKKPSLISTIHPTASIAPSSIIGNGVSIGAGSVIGPNVVIADGVQIGENCFIHSGVIVNDNVQIGSNVVIHPGAVIGSESFEFVQMNDGTYEKLLNIGIVIVEDNVEIGANTTIDKGTIGNTIIGSGTKIDSLVKIGHEVKIGRNCIIVSQVGIAGWVRIGDCTTIYGQSGIVGDIEIGSNVVVMSKSVVTKNIPNNITVSGNPAIKHKENLKLQALLKLGL